MAAPRDVYRRVCIQKSFFNDRSAEDQQRFKAHFEAQGFRVVFGDEREVRTWLETNCPLCLTFVQHREWLRANNVVGISRAALVAFRRREPVCSASPASQAACGA